MSKTVVKKYRFILALCVQLLVILCLAGCGPAQPVFMHDRTEIEKIEIVEAYYDFEINQPVQICLSLVDDNNTFMDALNQVECKFYYGDPVGVDFKVVGVKITYQNGDYEVFCYQGRAEYFYETDEYSAYEDRGRCFDKQEFGELLQGYLGYFPFDD